MIRKYPDHFYDPIRIEIAVSQMRHDFRKLFDGIDHSQWKIIDKDISEWFSGEKYELEPVHDFWNFFNSFARGLKLKSLSSWITASNVNWAKKKVFVKDIIITWDFPGLDFMGRAPYLASAVIKRLNRPNMKSTKESMISDSEYRSRRFSRRDQFPIILFHDPKGGVLNSHKGYYILEGNRRTVRAILKDMHQIEAYVGQFTSQDELWPKNYWIKTGILRDLIILAIYYEKEGDEKGFETVRKIYQLFLRDFDVARIATFDKSFKTFETSDRLIRELLMEDLK